MEKQLEQKKIDLRNQRGFTLLEMMAVLVIIGVVFSVTIHRLEALSDTAYQKALVSAVQELNIRETLIWYDFKVSTAGWIADDDVFGRLDTKLGSGYYWDPSAGKLGGSLHFGPLTLNLDRTPSTHQSAGMWKGP
jgi:prepilin-type N-terminal cleavage/methylation domain-containing protein